MSTAEYSRKLDELDRLLNDPDVPMQPDRVWSLLAEVSRSDASRTSGPSLNRLADRQSNRLEVVIHSWGGVFAPDHILDQFQAGRAGIAETSEYRAQFDNGGKAAKFPSTSHKNTAQLAKAIYYTGTELFRAT